MSYDPVLRHFMVTSGKSSQAVKQQQVLDMDPRLPIKLQENVADLGGLAKQILRGSKSNEHLMQATRNLATHEANVDNSAHAEAIERSLEVMDTLQDQLHTLQR
ncbi:BLOC-1-related complex subunit 7-like isoform X2 [Acanthaster planci]|uniref:BLOC-1-related complex subunit 7 n=1 Tax=Acanthaster planci TaxID=133434 RepID=A0A8B7YTA9_ACAPL|nr:BLOC-1-related complex subunit 7-like isoform X2 [Acanthaster planci]